MFECWNSSRTRFAPCNRAKSFRLQNIRNTLCRSRGLILFEGTIVPHSFWRIGSKNYSSLWSRPIVRVTRFMIDSLESRTINSNLRKARNESQLNCRWKRKCNSLNQCFVISCTLSYGYRLPSRTTLASLHDSCQPFPVLKSFKHLCFSLI